MHLLASPAETTHCHLAIHTLQGSRDRVTSAGLGSIVEATSSVGSRDRSTDTTLQPWGMKVRYLCMS